MIHSFLAVLAIGALSIGASAGQTWLVDAAGGGDFLDLPEAIAAADPGDVVLVRRGDYSAFRLEERVVVSAMGPGVVVGASVVIAGIPAGPEPAGIAGLTIVPGLFPSLPFLEVSDCVGTIVCERITIDRTSDDELIEIRDCADVVFEGLITPRDLVDDFPASIVRIERSRIRMADVDVEAADGMTLVDAPRGGVALLVIDSHLVLARPRLRGGKGGIAPADPLHAQPGGDGGPGLWGIGSTIVIVGTGDEEIEGGPGGDGRLVFLRLLRGGDGGPGLLLDGGSCVASRVEFLGGAGGVNSWDPSYDGEDGPPTAGSPPPTFHELLPSLAASRDWHPGDRVDVEADGVDRGRVLLMVSDASGFATLPKRFEGPPLSVLPSAFFLVFDLGDADGSGDAAISSSLPLDPAITGLVLHLQALELAESGRVFLSNATSRVIGGIQG